MRCIELHIIDTNKVDVEPLFYGEFFSEKDRKEFEKYTHETVRRERIASRYFKNKYIKDYYVDENGKPLSKDKYFNISHTHGLVVLVVDEVPVGVDVEQIRKYDEELRNFISSEAEKEYINDAESFFTVWTNKEAVAKADGLGLREDVKKIPSLPINSEHEYHGQSYLNRTISYDNYVITVSRQSLEEYEVSIKEETL